MKIMPCPLNGPRNIQEFVCAGPVEPHPDPNRCSDHEWTEFVWMEENLDGVVREWWCHVATSYWFIAERDTVKDEILATYPADRVFAARVDFAPPAPPPEAARPPEPQPAPAETARAEESAQETPPAPAEAAAPSGESPAEEASAGGTPAGDTPDGETPPPEGTAG